MHNKVLEDIVIKMELLRKTGLIVQPNFVSGNTRFVWLIFYKELGRVKHLWLATMCSVANFHTTQDL